ncbi:hypothetical protein D3C81_2033240 [compost metagenome]
MVAIRAWLLARGLRAVLAACCMLVSGRERLLDVSPELAASPGGVDVPLRRAAMLTVGWC